MPLGDDIVAPIESASASKIQITSDMKKILLLFIAIGIALCTIAQQSGKLIDSRDSQTYTWVKIENQIWMAENDTQFQIASGVGFNFQITKNSQGDN